MERLQAHFGDRRASEHARTLRRLRAEAQSIRAKLEFAGELLAVEPVVVAACLATIALHHSEQGESSFEHTYPMLEGYMLGEDPLPFPRLEFFTKEELLQLLEMEQGEIL